jgi:hypothetical protein
MNGINEREGSQRGARARDLWVGCDCAGGGFDARRGSWGCENE